MFVQVSISDLNFRVFTVRDTKVGMLYCLKKVSPLDFPQYNHFKYNMFKRTYASYRVKRKSFYRKSELRVFFLISGGHIGAPKQCTNMVSPYKALQRCVRRVGK